VRIKQRPFRIGDWLWPLIAAMGLGAAVARQVLVYGMLPHSR
jgi:hypothetical protein